MKLTKFRTSDQCLLTIFSNFTFVILGKSFGISS